MSVERAAHRLKLASAELTAFDHRTAGLDISADMAQERRALEIVVNARRLAWVMAKSRPRETARDIAVDLDRIRRGLSVRQIRTAHARLKADTYVNEDGRRRPVTKAILAADLNTSEATLTRAMEELGEHWPPGPLPEELRVPDSP